MRMELVVAADENWGIGFHGTQNLVIPEDRRHFRAVTGHGTVIVGRRTLLDFPGGRPLPKRRNIVLSRDPDFAVEGAETAHSVEEALALVADGDPEGVFVCGGESVYRAFLPYCRRAYVTRIFASPEADAFFPKLEELPQWRLVDPGEDREHQGVRYCFQIWENDGHWLERPQGLRLA